uniref:Uncharacterized protein n=1 Tax=Compsopogon caeruleus TaxID=31354 RepID=A0A7S1XDY5_9RHOD|mmetsp:Transcript_16119/g.32602  ORF Transcript_16119/g.32602 Transcript_16119/m.32602 type:complete len:674 (+) Transcript_16119:94-2115(+)|eukprot:CAMPEP_0184686308 /NCGR_PEP_ID=MMETSP0312-20130426/21974_1 /TAXON_ID=31354 /ORGANISM="Compsopogon coeruleus, Strain SAG 36.94" /LENGTH=673 /DNA_ID=CAMNT_0027141253 /DNA_START=47 /DNA_END=2068 /DNA_ORIENTATION=-
MDGNEYNGWGRGRRDLGLEWASGRMTTAKHLWLRLRGRESLLGAAGSSQVLVFRRHAYENVVPNVTAFDVRGCPQVSTFRRFTPDGRYLVAFARNQVDVLLFQMESGGHRAGVPEQATQAEEPFDEWSSGWTRIPSSNRVSSTSPSRFTMARANRSLQPPVPLSSADHQRDTPSAVFSSSNVMDHPPPSTAGERHSQMPSRPLQMHSISQEPTLSRVHNDPSKPFTCSFDRFFTKVFEGPVATGGDSLVEDFCLATSNNRFLIFASRAEISEAGGATQSGEALEEDVSIATAIVMSITFHLFDLAKWRIVDRFSLERDLVDLRQHQHVHLLNDLLLILSMRHQTLHILRIDDSGFFAKTLQIGTHCSDGDSTAISRGQDALNQFRRLNPRAMDIINERELTDFHTELESTRVSHRRHVTQASRGMGNGLSQQGLFTGLLHRLLVFRYHKDRQGLYDKFGYYCSLVMFKAQFLDPAHILIRLGRLEQPMTPVIERKNVPCFMVFNFRSGEVISFLETPRELEKLLELYIENYNSFWLLDNPLHRPVDPNAQNELRGLREHSLSRFHMHALMGLPVASQSKNLSPYLNDQIFSYDERKLPALDGSHPLERKEYPTVKFTSRRSGALRFKLIPGHPYSKDPALKVMYLFHPFLPFVISMQQSLYQGKTINFHYGSG